MPVLRTGGKRDTLLRFRRHVILPDNQPRITTVLRGRKPSIRPFERAGSQADAMGRYGWTVQISCWDYLLSALKPFRSSFSLITL